MHLIHMPSLLIGGTEDIANIEIIGARVAMVCNGDIAMQIEAAPDDSELVAVQAYDDQAGRARIRLVWSQE